jgi:hypothetical protein
MRSRQLYSSVTGTVAGTVYFDVPNDTVIRCINFAASTLSVTAGDKVDVEVSQSATNQTAVSDAQGVLGVFNAMALGGGSPANVGMSSATGFVACHVPVKKGERIYLNVTEAGSATWLVRAVVFFD